MILSRSVQSSSSSSASTSPTWRGCPSRRPPTTSGASWPLPPRRSVTSSQKWSGRSKAGARHLHRELPRATTTLTQQPKPNLFRDIQPLITATTATTTTIAATASSSTLWALLTTKGKKSHLIFGMYTRETTWMSIYADTCYSKTWSKLKNESKATLHIQF